MIKLLDKQLRVFTIYAFFVLLCSIPVYYLIVDLIWIRELDEHNHISAEMTKSNLNGLKLNKQELEESLKLWNRLRPETRIEKVAVLQADSTYNLYRENRYIPSKGYDRFQGLITYFSLHGQTYKLTVETNVEETHETIVALTIITMVFFAILLMGFILLNKRISERLWKPFYLTLKKVRHFDLSGQKPILFEKNGIVEFEELNLHLGQMIDHTLVAYGSQKEFIENASHELQTPLSIVRHKLDLLQQDPDLTNGQSSILEDTYKAISRITRLNKNLLLLSKIENDQYQDIEEIEIAEKLKETLETLKDFALNKQLNIALDLQNALKVKGNKILLEVLLNNILLNAIRHSAERSILRVSLEGHKLVVCNSGRNALSQERLFKRFSRASEHGPGSGLGLSIAKRICERYGWLICYDFKDGFHKFSIDLRGEIAVQNLC